MSDKTLIGGLIGFLAVSGLVGWIFFSGVNWSDLDPRTKADLAAAKAAALVEWQCKQEIHSLVVMTVFSADLDGKVIKKMPLEARLEIAGAENLNEVCHRMLYVFEAILRVLTSLASEVVDGSGKL